MKIQKISLFLLCAGAISAACGMEDLPKSVASILETAKAFDKTINIHSDQPLISKKNDPVKHCWFIKEEEKEKEKLGRLLEITGQIENLSSIYVSADKTTLKKLIPDECMDEERLSQLQGIVYTDITPVLKGLDKYIKQCTYIVIYNTIENHRSKIDKIEKQVEEAEKNMPFWDRHPKKTFFGLGMLTCGLMLKAYSWWKSPVQG